MVRTERMEHVETVGDTIRQDQVEIEQSKANVLHALAPRIWGSGRWRRSLDRFDLSRTVPKLTTSGKPFRKSVKHSRLTVRPADAALGDTGPYYWQV